VFAWQRKAPGEDPVIIVSNFTQIPRPAYRLKVPRDGVWREAINTDAEIYGGSGMGNMGSVTATDGWISLLLPPLATLILTIGE
jgi:1,4-alpha-glucan branching enzyme